MTYFVLAQNAKILRDYISHVLTEMDGKPKRFKENGVSYNIDKDYYLYVTSIEQMYGAEQYTILLLNGWAQTKVHEQNIDEFTYFCSGAVEVIYVP